MIDGSIAGTVNMTDDIGTVLYTCWSKKIEPNSIQVLWVSTHYFISKSSGKVGDIFLGCHICLWRWYFKSSHPKINFALLLFFKAMDKKSNVPQGQSEGEDMSSLCIGWFLHLHCRRLALRSERVRVLMVFVWPSTATEPSLETYVNERAQHASGLVWAGQAVWLCGASNVPKMLFLCSLPCHLNTTVEK